MSKPILYDFFATWCGPCRIQSPIVHSLKERLADKVDVELVDHVGNGGVGAGPLVGADHGEGGIVDIGHQDAVEHILHHVQSGVHNHLDGVAVFIGVLHVLALDVAHALQLFQGQIAVGQPGGGFKTEFIVQCHKYFLLKIC